MEFARRLFDLLRHLGEDEKWRALVDYIGVHSLYGVIFLIVFCETGLVVTPFLPGDSLIFAIGTVAARGVIDIWTVAPLLICAALCGDNLNYWLGRRLGPTVFRREDRQWQPAPEQGTIDYARPEIRPTLGDRLLNRKHLAKAQHFYEKYGSKTIILARFVPIVRTFAPFVAGIGRMNYARFLIFSVVGAIAWVSICLTAGYYLGSLPLFKKHFELVILAIVVISVLPMVVEVVRARRHHHSTAAQSEAERQRSGAPGRAVGAAREE
jgi:membrane-associated protein